MEKQELFNGLESARKEYNNWQGKARIYIDFEDMTAWCRVFELPEYESDTIAILIAKNDLNERDSRCGKDFLNEIAEAKMKMHKDGYGVSEISVDEYMIRHGYLEM